MGFMGCVIGANEMYNQYENKIKEESLFKEDDLYDYFTLEREVKLDVSSAKLRSLKLDYSKF